MPKKRAPTHLATDGNADTAWLHIKNSTRKLNKGHTSLVHPVAKTTYPIPISDPRPPEPVPPPPSDHSANNAQQGNTKHFTACSMSTRTGLASPLAAGRLNGRDERRLSSGKFRPDTTIDLHGMRTEESLLEVHRCIKIAYQNTYRTVKIITGKGERRVYNTVRTWLSSSEANVMVVAIAHAPRHQGGDGVLLVRIRRHTIK